MRGFLPALLIKENDMENFATSLRLSADIRRMGDFAADFTAEMQRGLCGEASSLLMLPAYISPSFFEKGAPFLKAEMVPGAGPAPEGAVIAIDAGGTNLRIALVGFPEGAPEIRYFQNYRIPGFEEEVTADEFFDRLALYLAPIIDRSGKIGFCFSNPAEILPNRDARILSFTKELKVRGASGRVIGESLRAALRARGLPADRSVAVLNDAVATQLGAMADFRQRDRFGGWVGLILGTGLNISYTEANERLCKDAILRGAPGGTIINIEAGGYKGFPLEEADRRFISSTADPEDHWFEKMISGAYQSGLLLEWIRFAAEERHFSPAFSERLGALARIPTGEADRFCLSPAEGGPLSELCGESASDAERLRALIEAFFDRAAFLLACALSAVLTRTAAPDPARPVCISAEGATFYKSRLFRPRLAYYMEKGARARLGLHCRFTRIENATLLGAALAGLAGN
jgi:hexokinase